MSEHRRNLLLLSVDGAHRKTAHHSWVIRELRRNWKKKLRKKVKYENWNMTSLASSEARLNEKSSVWFDSILIIQVRLELIDQIKRPKSN